MPKFLKSIWFGATVLLFVSFVVIPLAYGYNLGFLSGYQLQSSNVIGLLGVIGTLSAVGVAVWIPAKIAKQQNEIALFKERYEVYVQIKNLLMIDTLFIGARYLDSNVNGDKRCTSSQTFLILFYSLIKSTYPEHFTYDTKVVTMENIHQLENCFEADVIKFMSIFTSLIARVKFLFGNEVSVQFEKLCGITIEYLLTLRQADFTSHSTQEFQQHFRLFKESQLSIIEAKLDMINDSN